MGASSSAAVEVTPASRFPVRGNAVSPAGHVSPRTRFSGSRGSRRELRRGEGSSQAPAQGKAATARRRGREMPPWGPAWAAPLSLAHAPSPPPPRPVPPAPNSSATFLVSVTGNSRKCFPFCVSFALIMFARDFPWGHTLPLMAQRIP